MGREIGLTRERVRQIQVDALRGLRDVLRKQGLTRKVVVAEIQSMLCILALYNKPQLSGARYDRHSKPALNLTDYSAR